MITGVLHCERQKTLWNLKRAPGEFWLLITFQNTWNRCTFTLDLFHNSHLMCFLLSRLPKINMDPIWMQKCIRTQPAMFLLNRIKSQESIIKIWHQLRDDDVIKSTCNLLNSWQTHTSITPASSSHSTASSSPRGHSHICLWPLWVWLRADPESSRPPPAPRCAPAGCVPPRGWTPPPPSR